MQQKPEICHCQTSARPQMPVQNSYGVLQKRKKSSHFYLLQHHPTTRHYKHHPFPSQVLKNSFGHFVLSYFVILSFSLTSQVLQAASLEQVILWRFSPFILYLSVLVGFEGVFCLLTGFKIQLLHFFSCNLNFYSNFIWKNLIWHVKHKKFQPRRSIFYNAPHFSFIKGKF